MKHISVIFLFICIVCVPACDVSEGPPTDPTEMYDKAITLLQERSFKKAKPLLEHAVASFRDLKKTTQLIEGLLGLVRINLELCEFRAAFVAAEQATTLIRKEGDIHGEIKLAMFIGDLYAKIHMYNRAVASYRTAASTATAFDDMNAIADARLQLASILKVSGDFDDAQEEYKGVLAQAKVNGDRQRIALALFGIGSVYRMQQRYVEAVNSLTQGLASTSRTRDPLLAARLQMEIGILHAAQNNANVATRDFRDAINILRRTRTNKLYETVLLFHLGQLYEQNGRIIEAKRYYNEALELARSQGDHIAENYLYIFLVRCNFNLMTPEQQLQSTEKLLQSYEQIAKKFQECNHITGEGYLYTELGRNYESNGNLIKAQELYLKAVMLDQNMLTEYYDEELHTPYYTALGIKHTHENWYYLLGAVLIKMQREEEALKVVEFARAKYLANTFQNIEVSLRHPGLKQQTKEVQSMLYKTKLLEAEYTARLANSERSSDTRELNALRVQINEAKKTLRTGSWEIINTHSNYETLVLTCPINVATLRRYVPPGALAIEFLPTEEQLYIFALTRSQLLVRSSMVSRDSLMKLMMEYRKLLQDPSVFSGEASDESVISMTRFAVLSTQLYDLLLLPVDDLFDRSLIIAENQEMDGFPFHAIERQDRRGNITYVIEMTSVDYMPSLASLRYHSTATSHIQEVVAFGNPTGKNWSVDYELRDIRSFFKGATVMVGLETSWDNLKSVTADILQISTEFSRQNIESSLGKIVLSNGLMVEQSTTVPFEKLSELEAIPVIILSNYYGQGEGLSAEHALLLRLNGTSDIFLNAWLADRKAAKFFSEYFFTHLANGLAPGDAYRQALLNLIRTREVSHPRSWGQFFHFGIG